MCDLPARYNNVSFILLKNVWILAHFHRPCPRFLGRAANCHALSVRLTHFTPFHLNLTLSRIYYIYGFFFFFCLSEVCDVRRRRVPLLCACYIHVKMAAKISEVKKKWRSSPPPLISFFGTCATFIGCERTGLAYLTPNPHPKLAALS